MPAARLHAPVAASSRKEGNWGDPIHSGQSGAVRSTLRSPCPARRWVVCKGFVMTSAWTRPEPHTSHAHPFHRVARCRWRPPTRPGGVPGREGGAQLCSRRRSRDLQRRWRTTCGGYTGPGLWNLPAHTVQRQRNTDGVRPAGKSANSWEPPQPPVRSVFH